MLTECNMYQIFVDFSLDILLRSYFTDRFLFYHHHFYIRNNDSSKNYQRFAIILFLMPKRSLNSSNNFPFITLFSFSSLKRLLLFLIMLSSNCFNIFNLFGFFSASVDSFDTFWLSIRLGFKKIHGFFVGSGIYCIRQLHQLHQVFFCKCSLLARSFFLIYPYHL